MPTKPNKKEEIGNLPEKEFRILIVKMIQNLEIKMESQINSLETRIEKMHSNTKEKSKAFQTSKSSENSAPPNQLSNKF